MPVTDADLAQLAGSPDIISLGMLADDARRRAARRTDHVRSRRPSARRRECAGDVPVVSAGEMRLDGTPSSRGSRPRTGRPGARGSRGCARSRRSRSPISSNWPRAKRVTLRALLEELARRRPRADCRGADRSSAVCAPVDRRSEHCRARPGAADRPSGSIALTRYRCSSRWPICSARLASSERSLRLPRAMNPAVPTTGYDDVKRIALARLIVDNVPVDSSGLVALRTETGSGGAHRRCRRRRRRVGRAMTSAREGAVRRSKRSGATSSPPGRSPWSGTAASISFPHDTCAPWRGRVPQCPAHGLRPRAISTIHRPIRRPVGMRPAAARGRHRHRPGVRPSNICAATTIESFPTSRSRRAGRSLSVALYTARPIHDVRSIVMDTSSRTSVALVRVLCARLVRIEPLIDAASGPT